MRRNATLVSAVVLGLVLTMATHLVFAQDSAPQSPLGTAFTYQGRLEDTGGTVNDTCDFRFKLYDAAISGAQIDGTQTVTGVAVSDGLFTLQLDFGAGAFEGHARWLEIALRCPAGSGIYGKLSPRQPLTPAPYALYAAQASGAHDHWGGSWGGPGIGLVLTSSNNIGLYGAHDASSGTEPGVKGETESSSGGANGVLGLVSSTSSGFQSAGVKGVNEGTLSNGIGVYGEQKGSGSGVYGTSPQGKGVFGYVTGDSGGGVGVEGRSNSPGGIGVYGKHVNTGGTNPGVKGETYSKDAYSSGVLGVVVSNSPGIYSAGVKGINNGTAGSGIGVYGAQNGSGWGVFGTTTSGFAGWFKGNVSITGSCTGCVMVYTGLNAGDSPLEIGDLVAVSGVSEPLAGASVPLLRVERASASNAGALVGVVHGRGQFAGTQGGPGEQIDNVVYAEGPAAPGDYLFIAVQGLVQVKADAGAGAIRAGDTLALAGTTAAHVGQVLAESKDLPIGRAMESLEQGNGLIWVMVDLQ